MIIVLKDNNIIITSAVLESLRAGDHEAYKKVFVYYKAPIENFLIKLLGSREDGAEVAQEVFVQLWVKRETIISSKGIKALLFTMAKNSALNYIRRKRKFDDVSSDIEHQYHDLAGELPDDMITTTEIRLLIESVINDMPEKRRQIYRSLLQDEKPESIAMQMDMPVENVYNHISRARKTINDLLTKLDIHTR